MDQPHDFSVRPGETITLKVTGVAAAGNADSVASNNSQFGGVYRRNRNRKNKTNRRNRNRKNKTNRRNRKN